MDVNEHMVLKYKMAVSQGHTLLLSTELSRPLRSWEQPRPTALIFSVLHSPNCTGSPGTFLSHNVASAKGYVEECGSLSCILTKRMFLKMHKKKAHLRVSFSVSEMKWGTGLARFCRQSHSTRTYVCH